MVTVDSPQVKDSPCQGCIGLMQGANDQQRGKLFSKISKQIVGAIKAMNGETDTSLNHYLASALHQAKIAQMPKQTLQDAIKRATSPKEQEDFKTIRFEGLAPETNAEIKSIFKKQKGALGPVEYLFQHKGTVVFAKGTTNHTLAQMTDCAMELDIEDFVELEDKVQIYCAINDANKIQAVLAEKGYEIKEFYSGFFPLDTIKLSEEGNAQFSAFLEAIETQDEVVNVYHNAQ
ncbi:hypothetical protein HDV01_002850 [Terramyces sp. JEL0728]|nr:hypothetical protein HDV01_002850 [Terramyces sp. JEL0728]